jgi:hypothetical protein
MIPKKKKSQWQDLELIFLPCVCATLSLKGRQQATVSLCLIINDILVFGIRIKKKVKKKVVVHRKRESCIWKVGMTFIFYACSKIKKKLN